MRGIEDANRTLLEKISRLVDRNYVIGYSDTKLMSECCSTRTSHLKNPQGSAVALMMFTDRSIAVVEGPETQLRKPHPRLSVLVAESRSKLARPTCYYGVSFLNFDSVCSVHINAEFQANNSSSGSAESLLRDSGEKIQRL